MRKLWKALFEARAQRREAAQQAAAAAAAEASFLRRLREYADQDDDYQPRTNAVPEGATVEEWEAGSGGDGYDEPFTVDRLPW